MVERMVRMKGTGAMNISSSSSSVVALASCPTLNTDMPAARVFTI
eukprot:CAMPEP_0177684398 /NCGR_PEP_ID=MMETSP0447-20121125/32419_1 /TAXON_ID=0 /ORGANISM="Stygamoeba regulata, Strain BSH-02190019" /LENGTH=44 /DNA_ID= /DNA_START= /DNA_END= /DNA_ORIENTATION=